MKSIDCLSVLFIDDEINLLSGIARNMHNLRPSWKAYFSYRPDDAVSLLYTYGEKIDIIVVDIEMPEIDGLTILKMVKRLHPIIVRITLSGKLDPTSLLGSTKLAHKHICKPIESLKLCDMITQAYIDVTSDTVKE